MASSLPGKVQASREIGNGRLPNHNRGSIWTKVLLVVVCLSDKTQDSWRS